MTLKNFLSNLKVEFEYFKNSLKNTVTPPFADGKLINGVAGLYLSLYSINRNISNRFFSAENIKSNQLALNKAMELEYVNIVSSFKVNPSVMTLKKLVLEYIPDYNFSNPESDHLEELKRLINSRKISVRLIDDNWKKVEGTVCVLPIKNYTFETTELVNISALQNFNHIAQSLTDNDTLDREAHLDILEDLNSSLLKEMTLFNFSIEEEKLIDLSGFKALPSLNGLFHANSQTYQVLDIVRSDFKKNSRQTFHKL